VEQHRRVIAAIAQREAHAAEQAMREHLELVRDGLLKVMTRTPLSEQKLSPINLPNSKDKLRHGT
jgi:DNA-binding GntR family transcriptional regulator